MYSECAGLFSEDEIEEARNRERSDREEKIAEVNNGLIRKAHFCPSFKFQHCIDMEQYGKSSPRVKGAGDRITWTLKYKATFQQKMSFHRL